MNAIQPFDYQGREVRVLDIDGESWWIAADIAETLGYSAASAMTRTLDDDEKGVQTVHTLGGDQALTIISEAGLYSAILRSRVDGARAFKRWITHDVLPQIRKTGRYSADRDEHRANATIFQARAQMELCQAAKGLIHPDHLEAKARIILARGMGDQPELESGRRPLYTQDYLREKNLTDKKLRSIAGIFGKRVKAAYLDRHGCLPQRYPLNVANGQVREVNAYTEADRPLLDDVWTEHFDPQGVLA